MVPAFLPSDKFGLYGRQCPKCHCYFRTHLEAFTTKNHGDFLNRQRELWVTAFNGGDDVTIDLDKIASELPENRPTWVPREQTQQFQFRCEMCESVTDILGEY